MKLSTKGRYATRMMLELAIHYGKGPMILKDIAKREDISEKYLGHLIPPLKGAGLINSSRGAHGGYVLAKAPADITLGQIIRSVEGNIAIVECVVMPKICNRSNFCVSRDIWGRISKDIMQTLNSITLQDMVTSYKEKETLQPITYII